MTQKSQSRYKKDKYDASKSTYKQEIWFRGKSNPLIGYSAKYSFDERADKESVLINWVLRMYKAGYLDQKNMSKDDIDYIEYVWLNPNGLDETIFKLTYHYAEWNNKYMNKKRLVAFIDKFYTMIREGRNARDIYNALYVQNRESNSNPLDLSTHRFSSVEDLNTYCRILKDHKTAAVGEVDHFYQSYKAKYFKS